jgi:hypothetical protein
MGGPVVRGFGLRFTEDAVTRELGGQARFDFLPEGLRCELEIPLPPQVSRRIHAKIWTAPWFPETTQHVGVG